MEMWEFVTQFWDQGIDIATLVVAVLGVLGTLGFLRKEQVVRGEKYTLEQERDDLRRKIAKLNVRLNHVDPERFIEKSAELYAAADFAKVEQAALDFAGHQQEAFGKAAEYLAEQRLIDSAEQPELAEDAARFAKIGQAAFPDSKRLEELCKLTEARKTGVEQGEPIEALQLDGMSDVELNHLSKVMFKDGKYVLSEIAARRSVPLAYARTGKQSSNFAGAIAQHAQVLGRMGDHAQAESLNEEALKIRRDVLGPEHPDCAEVLNNLSAICWATHRYDEAETLLNEALEILQTALGSDHTDTRKVATNLEYFRTNRS